ncbi:MAG TPA: protein kinase [Polyangia bacterium]|jgi:serine/threonine protein kinase|nr:protein kinase [Polyangia bacterium]
MSACAGCAAEVQLEDTFCARCGAPVTDPFIGTVVGERYRIVSRIGVGGMGAVYRAEHTMMRRDLAIKVLLPELSGKEEFARRFEREAESASRLAHPNIITVTDFGRTVEGSLFLAMEFLAGTSLSAAISAGPMTIDRALNIERQILRGLDHAHAAGVVHRDLKPENIMLVERDGQRDVVKILDFGIAKVTEPQSGGQALTQAGVIFGTPEYLSPEQALGEAVDARADVYAAGVILYEMLAGRRPFASEDKVKIISMHLAHAPPRIQDVAPSVAVPVPVEQAILQAMEKSRENRFATAAAFLQALDDAEAQGSGELGTEGTLAALDLSPARRGWALPLALALLVMGVGTLAVKRRLAHHGAGVLTIKPTRPAPPPPDLAAEMKKIEGWLEDDNTAAARVALETMLTARPKDARVRYMLGRVAYAEEHRQEALADYTQAIALDPGFRGDPVLLGHVDAMLADPKLDDAALSLLIDHVGDPAADLLAKVANEGSDLPRRRRAAAALVDLDQEKRVDRVALDMLELRKAAECEDKKEWVVKLKELGDPRALAVLRGLRGRRMGPISWGGTDTACMKDELTEAIAALDKKAGHTKERPERRTRRGR